MKNKAFTLTELIAVIVIIGLVIIVAIPVSNNLMKENEKDKAKLYVETLEKAIITYCDIYSSDENCSVGYGTLKEKNLISDYDYNGIKAEIENKPFERNSDIIITFKKDGNILYNCTKTKCDKN